MSWEIKFRGKRIDNGEWIYGNLIGNDVIVGKILEWDSEYFYTEFWWKVDPETVGQYTGLKDKNGKDIYQGDILECANHWGRVVIEWHNAGFRGKYFDHNDKISYAMIASAPAEGIEIIGSIHGNPELLNGESVTKQTEDQNQVTMSIDNDTLRVPLHYPGD